MKRTRSGDISPTGEPEELDPLAVALLACLRGAHPQHVSRSQPPQRTQENEAGAEADKHVTKHHSSNNHGRRGYVWRGPHREELTMHKKQQQQQHQEAAAAAASTADGQHNNSSSRRSSATQGMPSDDDEVAQQQQQHKQQKAKPRQLPKHQQHQQQQHHHQNHKDAGKEWAALTTWLRMNLHHPRTHKRVIMFLGEQDYASGVWSFRLNPELSWQEVGLETKLRLKTLLVEAEESYLQKYPGRNRMEWGSKVQKYKPPGSNITAEVCLWDVVNGLHGIYLQHEEQAGSSFTQQQQQQQGHGQGLEQQQQRQQQEWLPGFMPTDLQVSMPGVAAGGHSSGLEQQNMQQQGLEQRRQ